MKECWASTRRLGGGNGRFQGGSRQLRRDRQCRNLDRKAKLCPPSRDLVRVNVIKLRQLGHRPGALHRSRCHLCLESRALAPAWSSAHLLSCHAARWLPSGTKSTYPNVKFCQATSRPSSARNAIHYDRRVKPFFPTDQVGILRADLYSLRIEQVTKIGISFEILSPGEVSCTLCFLNFG